MSDLPDDARARAAYAIAKALFAYDGADLTPEKWAETKHNDRQPFEFAARDAAPILAAAHQREIAALRVMLAKSARVLNAFAGEGLMIDGHTDPCDLLMDAGGLFDELLGPDWDGENADELLAALATKETQDER